MNTRRILSGLIVLVFLTPMVVTAQSGGFSYEKAALQVTVSGPEPARTELAKILNLRLVDTYSLTSSSTCERRLTVSFDAANKEPSYNRNDKTHNCMWRVSLEFRQGETLLNKSIQEDKFGVFQGSDAVKEQAIRMCLESMAAGIGTLCSKYFPTLGTIRDIDEGILYLNRGLDHGMKAGQICDVFDGQGINVGAIKITSVQASQSTAKVITGGDAIDAGYTFQTRVNRRNAGLVMEVFRVPVESAFGYEYSKLVSTSGLADITSALGYRLAYRFRVFKASWSFGTGILQMDGKHPFFADLFLRTNDIFLVFDRLSVFGQAGGGLVLHGGRPYARPDGVDYDDPLENTGKTDMIAGYLARAGVGLNLWLSPNVTLGVEGGFFTSGEEKPSKKVGEGDNAKYYDISPTFVEYEKLVMEGAVISVTLTFLMDIMR